MVTRPPLHFTALYSDIRPKPGLLPEQLDALLLQHGAVARGGQGRKFLHHCFPLFLSPVLQGGLVEVVQALHRALLVRMGRCSSLRSGQAWLPQRGEQFGAS